MMSLAEQATAPELVTKSQFAVLTNVSPGRVSQWISERKLSGDALEGEGRSARIRVASALAQLKLRLDIDQRLSGNGISTRLDLPDGALPLQPSVNPATMPSPPLSGTDRLEEQIKRERLEAAKRQNRRLAEEEAERAGRFVLASEIKPEIGRALQQQMAWFEGLMSELATAICAKFELSSRDVTHALRQAFRECRERGSASFQAQAEALPAMIDDPDPDVEGEPLLAD